MNELKTLKDLVQKEWDIELVPEEYHIMLNDLKREAIKWIKKLESDEDGTMAFDLTICAQISWIKHFFNITEKDL